MKMEDQNQFLTNYHFKDRKFIYSIVMLFFLSILMFTADNRVSRWLLIVAFAFQLISVLTLFVEIRKSKMIEIFKSRIKYDNKFIDPQMIEVIYLHKTYIFIRKKDRSLFDEGYKFYTKDRFEMRNLKSKLIQFASDQNVKVQKE